MTGAKENVVWGTPLQMTINSCSRELCKYPLSWFKCSFDVNGAVGKRLLFWRKVTLGSAFIGVVCLMNDLITAERPKELGVIISIWFFCTVWRKDLIFGLIVCLLKRSKGTNSNLHGRHPLFTSELHLLQPQGTNIWTSYTLALFGGRTSFSGTSLYKIWCFAFCTAPWPWKSRQNRIYTNNLNMITHGKDHVCVHGHVLVSVIGPCNCDTILQFLDVMALKHECR